MYHPLTKVIFFLHFLQDGIHDVSKFLEVGHRAMLARVSDDLRLHYNTKAVVGLRAIVPAREDVALAISHHQ